MKIHYYRLPLSIIFLLGTFFMYSSCSNDDPETDPVPIQILRNPYMELWKNDGILYWASFEFFGDFETVWTDEEFVSATHSLKISAATQTDTTFAVWGQQALVSNIPYGKDLTLDVKIKGVDLIGDGLAIAIQGLDTITTTAVQYASTEDISDIKGTFDWTSYTVELDNVDEKVDVLSVFFIYMPNTTGSVYFDDAFLTYVPQ